MRYSITAIINDLVRGECREMNRRREVNCRVCHSFLHKTKDHLEEIRDPYSGKLCECPACAKEQDKTIDLLTGEQAFKEIEYKVKEWLKW